MIESVVVTGLAAVVAAGGCMLLGRLRPGWQAPVRHDVLVTRAARIAVSTADLPDILGQIVEMMAREGLRGASVALVGTDDRLRIVAAHGDLSRSVERASLAVGEGIVGHVAAEGRPLIVGDLDRPGSVRPALRTLGSNARMRSIAAVPISLDGRVVGVLEVDSSAPDRFEERDLVTMAQVALAIAWAIRRSAPARRQALGLV